MARHGMRRARPAELVPGTVSVVCAQMNYLAPKTDPHWAQHELTRLQLSDQAQISLYARGRDYHKVLRHKLNQLARLMRQAWGPLGYRVFTDSAPVLEVELACRAGLGWRGKHSLLLDRNAGSMFFLGEIFIDRQLPESTPTSEHCGQCSACMVACPTKAIVAPYRVDARRCISYLTIEHPGAIDPSLRPLMGNRIYGCDDCQLVCPWNKYAQPASNTDFAPRNGLEHAQLLELWVWSEDQFLRNTEGSAIRRIGYQRWQRNLAIALGNALRSQPPKAQMLKIKTALTQGRAQASALVQEHIDWALQTEA